MPLRALKMHFQDATRVQDALSLRETFDQLILGQLRSSVILVINTKKITFHIHYMAPSANVTFRLTLPGVIIIK
jgi:hypothetical protein